MVTQAEVARDWKTSRVYVHKCVRNSCSLESLQAARQWRDTYARQRPPTDPKQLQLLYGDQDSAKDNGNPNGGPRRTTLLQNCLNRPQPHPDSLEFPLDCARRAEEGAYILFRQALEERRDSNVLAALRNYNAALDGRLKIEQWYRREIEYRRHLIPMETARRLACKGLNVVVSNVLALPEKVGPLSNLESPAHAIAILRDECTSVIADIKKSWPEQFLDDVVWPAVS
jgi:hypothetical protein